MDKKPTYNFPHIRALCDQHLPPGWFSSVYSCDDGGWVFGFVLDEQNYVVVRGAHLEELGIDMCSFTEDDAERLVGFYQAQLQARPEAA